MLPWRTLLLENSWMLIFTLKTSVGCIVKVRLFADHLPAYLSEELSRRDWHLIRLSLGFLFFDSHSFWPIQWDICRWILLLILEQYLVLQIIFCSLAFLEECLKPFAPAAAGKHKSLWRPKLWGFKAQPDPDTASLQFRITEHWIGAADVKTCSLVYLVLVSIKLQQGYIPHSLFLFVMVLITGLAFISHLFCNSTADQRRFMFWTLTTVKVTLFYTTPLKILMKIYLLGNKI